MSGWPPAVRGALLALLGLLALALRSLEWPEVFVDGEVFLPLADASYHARRALYSFERFPAALLFDPYLAYPEGAPVPIPPLFDWALGGTARLFGHSQEVFERVAAWVSPALAALTVWPVYAAGRALAGAGVGLGAAAIFATLPISALFGRVGNADTHAFVALLGAWLLALSLGLARPDADGRALRARCAGLALVRAGLVLGWSGSLLYVALGDGALLLVGALSGRRALLRGQAASALASALLVAPWVALAPTPSAGPFASTTLSWLHVLALLAVAGVAASLAGLEAARPTLRPGQRLVRAGALAAIALLALLAIEEVRAALTTGLGFLGKVDDWVATEQWPLFDFLAAPRRTGALHASRAYGWYLYLLPLAWLGLLARLRRPEERDRAALLACWFTLLGVLAVLQLRFGSDFAPVAALGCALLLDGARRLLARRLPRHEGVAAAAAVLVGVLLLGPGLTKVHAPKAARAWSAWHEPERGGAARASGTASAHRFARLVREATPETGGYFDSRERPAYGVLAPPSFGHLLVYAARRPTPAGNFGPYLDPAKYRAVRSFFTTRAEAEAVAIARRLGTRYVMTTDHPGPDPPSIARRLHGSDGSAGGGTGHLGRFRLVTEGPAGGRSLRAVRPQGGGSEVPYKLFELVTGAVLEVAARPGAPVTAELEVVTPLGRRFAYLARGRADAAGIARLRVPYATPSELPAQPVGLWRVRADGREIPVWVPEGAVREGARVRVAAPGAAPG